MLLVIWCLFFWYALFNLSDLINSSTPCDDNEPDFKYDRLQANKSDAITLARSRLEILKSAFGVRVEDIFTSWIKFIESLSGDTICVETCELVMMDEHSSIFNKQAKKLSYGFF